MRLLVLILILCLPVIGSAGQVYKWRDKYGTTHYSDIEPVDQSAQRKSIKAKRVKALSPKEMACENARNNLKTFANSSVVQMDLNNDGVLEDLSAEQIAQQTKAMQAAVVANCSQ